MNSTMMLVKKNMPLDGHGSITKMKVTKRQLKRIIKEGKIKITLNEGRIVDEVQLMTDLDDIASAVEEIAEGMYGMSGPGTVSGDEGDEMAESLLLQVERLNVLYSQMVSHFESMDPENQPDRPGPSGVRGDIMTREDR
jgi:hypothetical protein